MLVGKKYIRCVFYLHELLSEKRQALLSQCGQRTKQDAFRFEALTPEGEVYPDQLKGSPLIQFGIGQQNG